MLYRTYAPAAELQPYVKCYWILRADGNPFSHAEPLIPDGCSELIFNLGAPYERYSLGDPRRRDLVKGSHVVGERTQPFLVEQLGAIDHVAIRFRPGGLYPFVLVPICELTNRAVGGELIFRAQSREMEERLFEAENDAERVALLDAMLLRRLSNSDSRQRLARAAACLITRGHGTVSVSQVCTDLDCDYKQLERSFLNVVGLRPKFFGRLTRFLAVLDELKTGSGKTWPQVALDFGYYDQAHLTKEFKTFTGVPPSQFRAPPTSITGMLTGALNAAPSVSNSYKTTPVGGCNTADTPAVRRTTDVDQGYRRRFGSSL